MTKSKKIFFTVILLTTVAVFVSIRKINTLANQEISITHETLYTLASGTGRKRLALQLEQQHIIKPSLWFPLLLRLKPELARVKAGTYRLEPGMKITELLQLLVSGKEAQFPLRLVEGQTIAEWLAVIRAAPYLKHTLSDDLPVTLAAALQIPFAYLEGQFYPDTWIYTASTSDVDVLKKSFQRMQTEIKTQWLDKADNLPYQNSWQLLIMASIIEKETGVANERSNVASVFINRLRLGMRLQTDPTVIYGLGNAYNGHLTKADLEKYSPYNTYLINGLPPGPIAIPSIASLVAAAHPADTQYLYFVANGSGGHTFSRNLGEHNQAVRYWRKVEKTPSASETIAPQTRQSR